MVSKQKPPGQDAARAYNNHRFTILKIAPATGGAYAFMEKNRGDTLLEDVTSRVKKFSSGTGFRHVLGACKSDVDCFKLFWVLTGIQGENDCAHWLWHKEGTKILAAQ